MEEGVWAPPLFRDLNEFHSSNPVGENPQHSDTRRYLSDRLLWEFRSLCFGYSLTVFSLSVLASLPFPNQLQEGHRLPPEPP